MTNHTTGMKIIGIVGILDLPGSEDRLWKHLRIAFEEQFPNAEFVVEHAFYLPWQGEKMRIFADSILKKYDVGDDIILIGYSLGGIIACTIAPEFSKSRVQKVVTIGTPHKLNFFYRMLNADPVKLPMPVFTFAGILDPFVPWFLTQYQGNTHTNVFSDHLLGFILSAHPASVIAQKVAKL